MNNAWEWVDLSPLGRVASLYFTLESSNQGEHGPKTPAYFCLDRLTVLTAPSSVEEAVAPAVKAYYDRAAGVVRVESDRRVDATLYSLSGTPVVTQPIDGTATIDMTAYPSGVYVIRCGEYRVKIVK